MRIRLARTWPAKLIDGPGHTATAGVGDADPVSRTPARNARQTPRGIPLKMNRLDAKLNLFAQTNAARRNRPAKGTEKE